MPSNFAVGGFGPESELVALSAASHLHVAGAPAGAGERRDRLGRAAGELQHVDDGRQVTLVGRGRAAGGGEQREQEGNQASPAQKERARRK